MRRVVGGVPTRRMRDVVRPRRGDRARRHVGVRLGQRRQAAGLDRQPGGLVQRGRRQRRVGEERDAVVAVRVGGRPLPGEVAGRAARRRELEGERVAAAGRVEVAVGVGVAPRALPVPVAVVARRVDPEHARRGRRVDLAREPAGAVERPEQERVRVDHDVRPEHVGDVVGGQAELVGRVVVEEPVGRAGRHVVGDLGHELAVARRVAVVVAPRQPVGLVERQPVLAVERRQLRARERVEPARQRRRPGRARRS